MPVCLSRGCGVCKFIEQIASLRGFE